MIPSGIRRKYGLTKGHQLLSSGKGKDNSVVKRGILELKITTFTHALATYQAVSTTL